MIEAAKYYEIMEEPFRALCPDQSGFMNFGLWPAPSLRAAQEALVQATLDALKARQGAPARIAEAGSGWGAGRGLVARTFPGSAYVGINFSRNQVEHARRVNAAVPGTSYVESAVEAVTLETLGGPVDALFAVEAAIHFDKAKFLNLARGWGVQALALAEILVEDMPALRRNPYASPALHRCWSMAEYEVGLKAAGFDRVTELDVTKAAFPGMAEHTARISAGTFASNPVILAQLKRAFADLSELAAAGKVRYVILAAERGGEQ